MNVTTIKAKCGEGECFVNFVTHECSFGVFLADMDREIKEFTAGKKVVGQMDIFWHLDEYCKRTYGACHWQAVSVTSLLMFPSLTIVRGK